jgi:stage II sporulation protein AA (anti-sigma F factor antagonist)
VSGELEMATEEAFRKVVDSAFDKSPCNLLFDLNDLTFIDSRGIGVLFETYHRLRTGDRMAIADISPHIQKLFTMLGLAGRVPIYSTTKDALNAELTE